MEQRSCGMTLRKDTNSVRHLESIALSAAAHLENSVWQWKFMIKATARVHLHLVTVHLILHNTRPVICFGSYSTAPWRV